MSNLSCLYQVPITIYCTWNKSDNILSDLEVKYQVILYNSPDSTNQTSTIINGTIWKYNGVGKFGNDYSVNVTAMITPNEHFNSSLSSEAVSDSFPVDQGKSSMNCLRNFSLSIFSVCKKL